MEIDYGKIPPQNIEAEEKLIASIMMDKDVFSLICDIVNENDFYKESDKLIFEAAKNLYNNDIIIDILTITNQLRKNNILEQIGGIFYLTQIAENITSVANCQEYALITKECSIKRQIIKETSEIYTQSFEIGSDINNILDLIQNLGENIIKQTHNKEHTFELSNYVDKSVVQYNERENIFKDGRFPGVPSRLLDFNKHTGGYQNSDLIIVAGRPSMGKTAFVLSEAKEASKHGFRPLFFSLEMSGIRLSDRLLIAESGINSEMFRIGNLSKEDNKKLKEASKKLKKLNFYINDKAFCSINYIKTIAKQYKQRGQCGILIIDYLQLADMKGKEKYNREQEVSNMSRRIKALAKDLDVPVILVSQLSREVEKRNDPRPKLSDLRESGAIEQDGDVVLFLFRPDYYNKFDKEKGDLKKQGILIIAKHRHAGTKDILFKHNETMTKFFDYNVEMPF